jgi:cytochrome c-type biogenesis protein
MEADVTLVAAFGAGLLSFVSPGVLPLIPGYLSYLAGPALDAIPGRAPAAALAFIVGFSLVFVSLGATASAAGQFVMQQLPLFGRLAAVVILLSGLHTMGLLRLGGLSAQERDHRWRAAANVIGALLVGAAFALGWTPVIGPLLAGIFAIAASRDTVNEGVGLLAAFAVGLAVPFFATALVINRLGATAGSRRHAHAIRLIAGTLLVVMGLLILTSRFTAIAPWLSAYLPTY